MQVVLNSGVWGGSKAAVQDVLAFMLSEFAVLYGRTVREGAPLSNFNMAVINTAVLQHVAYTWNVFTGRPFCAGQVRCTRAESVC